MVKRSYNLPEEDPDKQGFEKPSEGEHLFQVTDVADHTSELGEKLKLDENTLYVKCEIVGGKEEGRSLLQRLSLDDSWKGFFATRLFLKAIGEPHKGQIDVDTDCWIGRQFYAMVVHNGKYANIDQYNFEKVIEQVYQSPVGEGTIQVSDPKDIQW